MANDIFAGWAPQSSYDAAATPIVQFSRVYDETDLVHRHAGEPRAHLGTLDPTEQFYKADMGEGQLVLPLQYTGLGKLLKHALGTTVDAGSGPSWTHTHTLVAGPLPAFGQTYELHKGLPDSGFESKKMTGGKVKSLAIAAQADNETRITAALLGKKVDLAPKTASPTFTDLDLHAVNPVQIVVQIDGASAEVFGVEFTLDNNLRDDRVFLGSAYIAEPLRAPGKRSLTGRISKEWTNKALYDKFLAGSTATLLLTATGPTNYTMVIRVETIRFNDVEEDTIEVDQIPQTLPFRAFHNATHTMLKIVETNTTATT